MFWRTQGRFRPRPNLLNTFSVALFLSLLFHLSMLTIFNVVAVFPVPKIDYYSIEFVQATHQFALKTPQNLQLKGIGAEISPLEYISLDDSMELPTIEFAELERLRVGQPENAVEPFYDSPNEGYLNDSWGRFSGGLQRFGQGIREVTLGIFLGFDDKNKAEGETEPYRLAEGFSGRITWNNAGQSRKLLFAPPIQALWDIDSRASSDILELILEVNGEGRVVNVYSPSVDNQELLDAVQLGVLQYRFEPLVGEAAVNQLGTLRIKSEYGGQ